ncbi:RecF/RecN/SMC N terminal domain-containing protein, partial [Cardiosporidium cionae]
MFIEEIVLEGFKSYSIRTVIGPFSSQYNAITGLNGTGKSNILDALCFVFGIKNLQQMRVNRKDEFVYKQGKAGIDKASVSVKFNNSAKPSPLPPPYTELQELTITRQIVIGGRERYLINSHNKEGKVVEALLHAVNLNVNNPHFLVLQGRINEVVMYKPLQILGLLEEATGTRLYTTRRLNAIK